MTEPHVLYAGERLGEVSPDDLATASDEYTVSRAQDFATALERVREGPADAAVVTHGPDSGFDGVGFLETVRREDAALPVVLVPAEVDGAVARRAVAADVTALVPATDDDAREAIREAIDRHLAGPPERNSPEMPISDLTVEAERRLKERALDEAPIGITISDATRPDNPIIYTNESFEDMTGYPPSVAIGANHRFLQGPETDPEKVERLAKGIGRAEDTRVVLRNYTREETPFWNQVDVSPIVDESGTVTHYVGFQMDVTERKRAKRQLERERATLDRLLDRVNGLVSDVTEALVRADDRADIESVVTERVGDGEEYAAAWLGRYDETEDVVSVTEHTDAATAGDAELDCDGDAPGLDQLADVVADQEPRVVADGDGLPDVESTEACVLVPLTYRSTTYGVLAVCDDEGLPDDRERILLGSLGRTVGHSINDVVTKRTITTDSVIEVALEVDNGFPMVDLAAAVDAELDHEATTADGKNGGIVTIWSTAHRDAEAVVETARSLAAVDDAEAIVADEDGCVVQFRLAALELVDVLSEYGGHITAMRATGTGLSVEFRVGTERAARQAVEELEATYSGVDLRAYREVDDPGQTARGFREEVRRRLTDRQLTALQTAHVSGFFEWPRRVEGTQLAESMDVVPSTYHQHLQAAERKLVAAFLGG